MCVVAVCRQAARVQESFVALAFTRRSRKWFLLAPLCALLLPSCGGSDGQSGGPSEGQAAGVEEGMPIYVAPFYDAEGPQVDVGKYSDDLAQANANSIEKTIAAMKAEWDELRPEAMYAAAIRLFDLGLKDEAVYWFYSAQYRARLFQALCDPDQVGSMGDDAFELRHAYTALFQLTGAYINPYAFNNPNTLAKTVARVRTEGEAIPDFHRLYPTVEFVDKEKWPDLNAQVGTGISELLEMIEQRAASLPPDILDAVGAGDARRMDARRVWTDSQVAALATAAQHGDVAEIDRLVAAGVDVNTEGLGHTTPLYWALRAKNKPAFTRLLEHGASPNIETADGDSVMHFAAGWIGDSDWVELALKHGGDPNLPRSRHRRVPNQPPIFDAIGLGRVKSLQLLIEAGADVNAKDHENQTPLQRAVQQNLFDNAYQLLMAGARYDVESSDGKEIATLIRERVADPRWGSSVWHERVVKFIEQDAAKQRDSSEPPLDP